MSGWDDVAAAFTAGGVVVAAGALWAQLVQRREELAQRYNERYWSIRDRSQQSASSVSDDRGYLELCEDEFDAIRLGWVRASSWEVWHSAIRSAVTVVPAPTHNSQLTLLRRCVEGSPHSAGWECPALQLPRWRRYRLFVAGVPVRRMLSK